MNSPFARRLRRAVIETYEPEISLACKVGVLTAAGYGKAEIARLTGASPAAIRDAHVRLRTAAPNLEIPE